MPNSPPAVSPAILISRARQPDDLLTVAFAGIIGQAWVSGRMPLIRGMSDETFGDLVKTYFTGIALDNGGSADAPDADEFDELSELLLENRAETTQALTWLALAVASAAMGENHLWQDMGLPSRKVLSELMNRCFPALAAKNVGDMKWKKFFYRQLCERADVPICKSPHCADCCDYGICFGPED